MSSYRVNWILFVFVGVITSIFIGAGIFTILREGVSLTDIGLLIFCLVFIYGCIAFCWSKIILGEESITVINTLFMQTNITEYNLIRRVYKDNWFTIPMYTIYYGNNENSGLIRVNVFFHWKDMLRQIYTKVDKNVFDDDVKKKLGLK